MYVYVDTITNIARMMMRVASKVRFLFADKNAACTFRSEIVII